MRFFAVLIPTLLAFLVSAAPRAVAQTPGQAGAKDAPAAAQQTPAPEAKKKVRKAKPKAKAEPKAHVEPKAPAEPKAKAEAKKKAKPKPSLTKAQQDERYREGLAHEAKGNDQAALTAYLDAGNSGHGQAQRKLGDIYGKGNKAVKRDYDASLRWYEKARAQGVEIPKPHVFTKGR